jgi:hypothetical protein
MPVEALSELVAYRELLVGVAKEIFRARSGAQRLPRGFSDRLQLRLKEVRVGSAMPVLERIHTDEQPAILPREDEFTAARRLIEDAIANAASDEELPPDFPPDSVRYFNRFGKSLRPGEAIQLHTPGKSRRASYTLSTRKRLLLSRDRTYRSDRVVAGRVIEINAEVSRFSLRTATGEAIPCHFEPELFRFVHSALRPDGAGPLITVEGEAILNDRDTIQRIAVADVSYAEDTDDTQDGQPASVAPEPTDEDRATVAGSPSDRLRDRLAELRSMQDGWLDGQGTPPAERVIMLLDEIAEDLAEPDLPRVRVYPTPEAGVQLEWRVGSVEYSVEIRQDMSVYMVQVDTQSSETNEREVEQLSPAVLLEMLRGGTAA